MLTYANDDVVTRTSRRGSNKKSASPSLIFSAVAVPFIMNRTGGALTCTRAGRQQNSNGLQSMSSLISISKIEHQSKTIFLFSGVLNYPVIYKLPLLTLSNTHCLSFALTSHSCVLHPLFILISSSSLHLLTCCFLPPPLTRRPMLTARG